MTKHLLMFSVGPVEDFIKASRRTRDVHFSSRLVEEMAREAARKLQKDFQAELILPCSVDDADAPISDRVLVSLDGDVKEVLDKAEKAARGVWKNHIEGIAGRKNELGIKEDIWDAQADDPALVEFFAAWLPFDEEKSDYVTVRESVENLLNARESLTNFPPTPGGFHVAKSSLDGRRESVLEAIPLKPSDRNESQKKWFKNRNAFTTHINPGEELDLPGLVKRLTGGNNTHFPSVSRVAVDPFIRGAAQNDKRQKVLEEVAKKLGRDGQGISSTTTHPPYEAFPYDGQALFRPRLDALAKEFATNGETKQAELCSDIKKVLDEWKVKDPCPYLAVLACDGDRMTQHTRRCKTLEEHRKLSKTLTNFAQRMKGPEGVIQKHSGSLVYAGGDDVLAFLPLDKALDCAAEIRAEFIDQFSKLELPDKREATLSVGIAIVHMLTPMAGDMIRLAHEAESHAKRPRDEDIPNDVPDKEEAKREGYGNALAIHMSKRSGAPVEVRIPWPENGDDSPDAILKDWIAAYRTGKLPDRLAYELDNLAREFSDPLTGETLNWVDGKLVRAEVKRILKRKKVKESDESPKTHKNDADELKDRLAERITCVNVLRRAARELIVARLLDRSIREAEGELS